jgi:hypothetical protein
MVLLFGKRGEPSRAFVDVKLERRRPEKGLVGPNRLNYSEGYGPDLDYRSP